MNKPITRELQSQDISQAVELDKKWFGEHGISHEDLEKSIQSNPDRSLALLDQEKLLGFATFEILQGSIPKDYVGDIKPEGRILFVQQFTTVTNYAKNDVSADEALLSAVEQKARDLECKEVWEALAIDHPYSAQKNAAFDAFGFYLSHGFTMDKQVELSWKSNNTTSIPCYLFRLRNF